MNHKIALYLSLFILVLLGSCKSDDAIPIISEIKLEEELTLSVRELFTSDGSSGFIARLTTDTQYDCQDGKLRHHLIRTENQEIIVNVIGLDFPAADQCTGKDVATVDIDLGEIELNVPHSIQLSLLGEIKNSGTINNKSDRITVEISKSTGSGIVVDHNIVYKVPGSTIWGYINSSSEIIAEQDSLQGAFNNQLESMGSPLEKVGSFGHFLVAVNGAVSVNDFEKNPSGILENGFAINYTGNFEELTTWLESNYCADQHLVRLWDGNGNFYSCN